MAIMAMNAREPTMRAVNVAELKNRLGKYLKYVKAGEEVVIRDRKLPVAKLVPFVAESADDEDLTLVAAGKLRLPETKLDLKALAKLPIPKIQGRKAIEALLADRDEGL